MRITELLDTMKSHVLPHLTLYSDFSGSITADDDKVIYSFSNELEFRAVLIQMEMEHIKRNEKEDLVL